MAQAVCLDPATASEAYMPFPLALRHETAFQRAQIFVPLVGSAVAVAYTSYYGMALGTLAVTLVFSILTGLGITVGFHRLFTHRSFETVRPIRWLLAVFGSMSAQGTIFLWVASHRQHHQFSDRHGDPHSPIVSGRSIADRIAGFLHSHIGWMLEGHMTPERLRYVPDFVADPFLCRVQRWHLLWVVLGFVLPALSCYAIVGTLHAAMCGLLWGGFVRIAVTDNISFFVNSLGHMWGKKPYASHDESRNNGLLAMISLGDGWHNNHHAFPTSARHGFHWWQFDASFALIRVLEACGLIWNVKLPTAAQIDSCRRDAE